MSPLVFCVKFSPSSAAPNPYILVSGYVVFVMKSVPYPAALQVIVLLFFGSK